VAQDVEYVLNQYETAPDREPMHAKPGEIRRGLSTDEKRVKRQIQRNKTADLEDPVVTQSHTATVADLLGQAGRAETLDQQRALVAQAEALRTAHLAEQDEQSAYHPEAARIRDVLVPAHAHERTTEATDWLLGLETTSSLEDATQEMLAQASLWFGRVSEEVKAHGDEYFEQARGKGRHIASAYGDHAEAAERTFLDETTRLHALATKAGEINLLAEGIDSNVGGFTYDAAHEHDADPAAPRQSLAGAVASLHTAGVAEDIVEPLKTGEDVAGLQERSDEVARQALGASGVPQVGDEGMPEGEFSSPQGGPNGYYPPAGSTDSNRAPALQELNDTSPVEQVNDPGLGHTDDRGVNADNGTSGPQDAAQPAGGFPVGANLSTTASKESSMAQEHAQCPTCGGQGKLAVRTLDPRQAYSGLPQIDQIVNADDSPGNEPAPGQAESFPSQVAWPITLNNQNVPDKITEAEQQIRERNQRSPLAGGAAGSQRTAMDGMMPGGGVAGGSGRDNSGWLGDMGVKGTDYPGYSAPTGYDGSSNLGQPDPVYGEGGDNPNQPHTPYGAQEANDYTNNADQNWQPGQPTQGDQGYREVAPQVGQMNTMGGLHDDPAIRAAQEQILAAQRTIAMRNAQLQGQG